MITPLSKTPSCERTPSTQAILRAWREDRCVSASSAQQYLQWIDRFRRYCRALGLEESAELTRAGVKRFQAWYTRSRKINSDHLGLASSSLRSLRRVHEVMGIPVPPWQPIGTGLQHEGQRGRGGYTQQPRRGTALTQHTGLPPRAGGPKRRGR